jgi:hypothetical protein
VKALHRHGVKLIVVAIIAVLFIHLYARRRHDLLTRCMSIGEDLVTHTNSPHLVTIGPSLQAELTALLSSKTHVSKVRLGDEPRLGDGRASARLILTNEKGAAIGIRLRKEKFRSNRFHVLGYWTVFEADPDLPVK